LLRSSGGGCSRQGRWEWGLGNSGRGLGGRCLYTEEAEKFIIWVALRECVGLLVAI